MQILGVQLIVIKKEIFFSTVAIFWNISNQYVQIFGRYQIDQKIPYQNTDFRIFTNHF